MQRSKFTTKVYKNVYEDEEIFLFHLDRFAKISAQFFYRLHEKRSKNLGVTDFNLPFEVLPDGKLKILQINFRTLENLFLRNILENPDYVYTVIERRRGYLQKLRGELIMEETLLQRRDFSKTSSMQVFETATDFSSFYLEYYFPYDFFQNKLVQKMEYTPEENDDIVRMLLTPTYRVHMRYYKYLLELATKQLSGAQIDFDRFSQEIAFMENQDLKENEISTPEKLAKCLERVISGRDFNSVYSEIKEIEANTKKIKSSHVQIKYQLQEKARTVAEDPKLITSLVDLLIDTGLENEENHYWRNRTFAYFRDLAKGIGIDYRTVTIQELAEKVRNYKMG